MELGFRQQLKKYQSFISGVSRRFEIRGLLSQEDLFQEGLITLHISIEESEHPLDTEEFARYFRSKLYYAMRYQLRYYRAKSRDWTHAVRQSTVDWVSARDDDDTKFDVVIRESAYSNLVDVEIEALLDRRSFPFDKFIDELKNVLRNSMQSTDALKLLDFFLNPDYEIPENVRKMYNRIPSNKYAERLLSRVLNWDRNRLRRAKERLREAVRELMQVHYGERV